MFKVFCVKIKRKYFNWDEKLSELQKSHFFAWTLRLVVGFFLGTMLSLFLFQGIEDENNKQFRIATTNNQVNKNYYLTSLSPVSANDDKAPFWSFSGAFDNIIQDEASVTKPLHHLGGGPIASVLGDQKIAVILVNFKNTTQPEITKGEAQDIIFTKANNYYQEISYNKISLSGDVFGWYQLSIDQTCDPDITTREAIKVADLDVYFPNYNGVMVVTPIGCFFNHGGKSFKSPTNDGDITVFQVVVRGLNLGLIAHELGHGFGNYHAGLLGCFSDYCDPFDVMGVHSNLGHFNAPHKEHVGWFDPLNVGMVSASGIYALQPLESASSGLQTIKIQRSSRSYLYVEYRRLAGHDASFKDKYGDGIFDGALMHVTGGLSGIGYTSMGSVDTFLIDPTPNEDKSFIIRSGENYVDPATKTKITVTSISENSLGLNVDLGTQDNTGPTISIVEPEENETVSREIEVISEASDPAGIDHVRFVLNNKALGDSTAPFTASYNTVDPSAKWADGTYGLSTNATDGAFNNTYLLTVRNIKVDNSSILAEIKSPQSGSYIRDIAIISPSSSSKTISKVEFFKDFEKTSFTSAVSAPFEASWDTKTVADGTYRLKAKIYYTDGNFSTSKVNITVDNTAPSEPSNFKITSANAINEISLDWDDSTDVAGIKNYKIYRDEIEIAAISESIYLDSNLAPSTTYVYQISAVDKAGNESIRSRKIPVTTLPSSSSPSPSQDREQSRESKIDGILVAPFFGRGSQLRLFKTDGTLTGQFFAYEKSFRGGVSFVSEDLDNDGIREIITAPGSGRDPEVRIFNLKGVLLYKFLAYSKTSRSGVNIATGDLDSDGNKEIIVSPRNGAPQIRIFNLKGGKWTQNIKAFYAYSKNRNYAVNIAIADIDGDGKDEIITTPEAGVPPVLKVFGLRNNEIKQTIPQFYAYDKDIRYGTNLSAGDIDGDGKDEIIISPSTGNLDVKILKISNNKKLTIAKQGFFPFGRKTDQGINTATVDINGDGKGEIIASIAGRGKPLVRIFSSDKFKKLKEFKVYPSKSMTGLRAGKW